MTDIKMETVEEYNFIKCQIKKNFFKIVEKDLYTVFFVLFHLFANFAYG